MASIWFVAVVAFVLEAPGSILRTRNEEPEPAPEPEAAAPEAAALEEPIDPDLDLQPTARPPTRSNAVKITADEFRRKGALVGVGVGATNCTQPDCNDIVLAGLGHLEFGYRFGIPAIVAAASVGGAKLSVPIGDPLLGGHALFVDVGGGLELFPVRTGRVDPFISATLGYSRMAWTVTNAGQSVEAWYSRGSVRLGTGLNIYLDDIVAIGPRVDITLPFAGKLCVVDVDDVETCDSISDLVAEGENAYDKRGIRRSLAKPWSATINLHVFFG